MNKRLGIAIPLAQIILLSGPAIAQRYLTEIKSTGAKVKTNVSAPGVSSSAGANAKNAAAQVNTPALNSVPGAQSGNVGVNGAQSNLNNNGLNNNIGGALNQGAGANSQLNAGQNSL